MKMLDDDTMNEFCRTIKKTFILMEIEPHNGGGIRTEVGKKER